MLTPAECFLPIENPGLVSAEGYGPWSATIKLAHKSVVKIPRDVLARPRMPILIIVCRADEENFVILAEGATAYLVGVVFS